jgi:hypothetical protein
MRPRRLSGASIPLVMPHPIVQPRIPDSASHPTALSMLGRASGHRLPGTPTMRRAARLSDPLADGELVQAPLGRPADGAFDAVFLAKVAFMAEPLCDADPASILGGLRKERVLAEFVRFAREGQLAHISAQCQRELAQALLAGLAARPLRLSDRVQTDEWTTAVPDPHFHQTMPFYELLCALLHAAACLPPLDAGAARALMDRTQAGDARERAAAAKLLALYYERDAGARAALLAGLEAKLIDVRDGQLHPFAAPPLLLCLFKAMEVSLDADEPRFRRVMGSAVLPLLTFRYLSESLQSICAIFLKFMGRCPPFGLDALRALQRNWPLSTRAGATARLAIAVFCGLDPQYARVLAPSFLDFLAACLASPDAAVVTAVLGMFERASARELILARGAEAIAKLYDPLRHLVGRYWLHKSDEKLLACMDTLAKADPAFFEAFVARDPRAAPPRRSFPLPQWETIADLAGARDGEVRSRFLAKAAAVPTDGAFGGVAKIVDAAMYE